ncbi:bifunctional ornithine acetyltransferase/N-acetylglutamate synthase [Staphylococcus pseudintermedius]|uniref:bifunctional ornithine acetyltransferase/N-acetylglutamate synthase n=1 Tax=Staphylococcus pseudintermedius TaxID=283734 RepID=UPI001649A791|nr:bifunctional ornithine acetyltransferase/N-acetylglutamate synthase [Staphylococcus pseudintermedius]
MLGNAAIGGEDAKGLRRRKCVGESGGEREPKGKEGKRNQRTGVEKGRAGRGEEQERAKQGKQEKGTREGKLGLGNAAATAYGCDLSYGYVRINASYRT